MRFVTLFTLCFGLLLTGRIQAQDTLWRKKLPAGYEQETMAALSCFPELQKVPIKFRIAHSYSALRTRPTVMSMFLPKGYRSYVIFISNKTISNITPISFQNLPGEARIGVIGHELSHVVDFNQKSTWRSLQVALRHFSIRYMDSLEYHTDKICIDHGLGLRLYAWSRFVRETLHIANYRGADYVLKGDMHRERYMNPDTILHYIDAHGDK